MKAVIFDFDGTLADSFATLLAIFEEMTSRPTKLTQQEIKTLRGSSLKQIIRYLKIRSWQIPRLLFMGRRLIAKRIDEIKPFRDLPDVLKQLHSDGHQMYVLSTNSRQNISHFLKTNKMDGYFAKVYGDIGLRSKAMGIKKIMKKEKIRPADCLYVGDEVRDVEAARKAGVISVAVGWGFNYPEPLARAKPAALATKPEDLLKIIAHV